MCGIAGIHGLDAFPGKDEALGALRDMVAAMGHRGPDAEGVWCQDDVVALGHRRLSILDPTPGSNQPFALGRDVLVFNGEVYNFRELRAALQSLNYEFTSNSDTEVVLNGYHAWNENVLNKLEGMFAIAIWDDIAKTLFLAIDRLGEKPIYYHSNTKSFIFASNLNAINHFLDNHTINNKSFRKC